METLLVKVHVPNILNEYIALKDIDFQQKVSYLKKEIAKTTQCEESLEVVYQGQVLDDDQTLSGLIRPKTIVHCFSKIPKTEAYKPVADVDSKVNCQKVQQLFTVISNIQINVSSRVNILQKILAEYPEFRKNLGAQALIRDSVLFGTLEQLEVVQGVAVHYPIICEAAEFIVDTIKKELTRSNASNTYQDLATDSTNSSEEENSITASTSSTQLMAERVRRLTTAIAGDALSSQQQSPTVATTPIISRQQLQTALAQINVDNMGSANSLANIAQRDTAAAVAANPLPTSASGERLSNEIFRHELLRALNAMSQELGVGQAASGEAVAATAVNRVLEMSQNMETDAETTTSPPASDSVMSSSNDSDIPAQYRSHQYAEQLRTMIQMGFIDCEENINYLNISNGNIEIAINLLMGAMN